MRLLHKFLLLVGLVSCAVVLNAGVSAWVLSQLKSELTEPIETVDDVLGGVNRLKRDIWRQSTLLPQGELVPPTTQNPEDQTGRTESLEQLRAVVLERLDRLGEHEEHLFLSGAVSARLLAERVAASQEQLVVWMESRRIGDARRAYELLLVVHELIERIESKLIEDSRLAVGLSADLSRTVVLVMATSGVIVVLTIVYTVMVFRRWFIGPLDRLRVATREIGGGNYAHRVETRSPDEIGQLSSDVNRMASLVEATQRERVERERLAAIGEMSRRIVHNLRNPLAGIRGLTELTREEVPGNEQVAEYSDRIIGSVDQFQDWLGSLLDATRPLELNVTEEDVASFLDRVIGAHEPSAIAAGVTLVASSADGIGRRRFDREKLEQAASALVSNAIDASPRGGVVSVTATGNGDGSWALAVEDDGEGVPDDLRDRIFDPWVTTKSEGTGIGLALVRRVGTEHGADVRVEDAPGGSGARFSIVFP